MGAGTLGDAERLQLARAYVALSCAHRVQFILPMLDEAAVYSSANVGEFTGREAIGAMMTDFFSRYPDVYWQVEEYRQVQGNTIEFEFEMIASAGQGGTGIRRRGREHIEFTPQGLITRIDVG